MRRILGTGPVATEFMSFAEGEEMAIHRVQDVEPILDQNKRLQNDGTGWSPSRELKRKASIPLVVWELWLKEGMPEGGKEQRDFINRKLRDPDYRWLRTM